MAARSPTRRRVQRWIGIGWGRGREQPDEFGVQVAALGMEHAPELGGHGQPAGGGEPLGDLLHAEQAKGSPVDAFGAGAQSQAQHHVGQVHDLAPGGRTEFDEGHIDQQEMAVADQQVGRLAVAMGQPGVPQLADDQQGVIDDVVVDGGLAELDRTGEELRD
jgi:hypothetical protein